MDTKHCHEVIASLQSFSWPSKHYQRLERPTVAMKNYIVT